MEYIDKLIGEMEALEENKHEVKSAEESVTLDELAVEARRINQHND